MKEIKSRSARELETDRIVSDVLLASPVDEVRCWFDLDAGCWIEGGDQKAEISENSVNGMTYEKLKAAERLIRQELERMES